VALVPTAVFSTDLRRDLTDLRALVAFRRGMVRGKSRRRLRLVFAMLLLITVASAVLPAIVLGAGSKDASDTWGVVLTPAFTAFLLMAAGSSIASGGGRELVSRDHSVAFPISPTADHFGALLMAPLNIAWLLQFWLLLSVTTYVAGPVGVLSGPPLVLAWAALATALAQIAGWLTEALRRGPAGVLLTRTALGVGGLGVAVLVATDNAGAVFEPLPARLVVDAALDPGPVWPLVLVLLLALTVVCVLAGIPAARLALRRPARDEERLDTGHHRARAIPTGPDDRWGDFLLLRRLDRSAVLRSVPLRRGLLVLAVLPGLGGLAATLTWDILLLMPGLVAAGVALLFGVNAWALDGRGALWRESLPVDPRLVFAARHVVLAEMGLLAAATCVFLAGIHTGLPNAATASALVCVTVVVMLQMVATSARWSVRHPYSVDLRSARAVAAPPMAMLGYSTRLAFGTTCTSMVFSAVAEAGSHASPIYAVPFLLWSGTRLMRARRAWCRPATRAHVVTTVAA
jgi:hypothetical protein